MADEIRTREELIELFPTNADRLISAQNCRDWIVSTVLRTSLYKTGIGNLGVTDPAKMLEVLDPAAAQLRLTHTLGSKFCDFQVDTSHNLTVTPSSTGRIALQPTTDSTTFFQVLAVDDSVVLNVDTTNKRFGVGTDDPADIFNVVKTGAKNITYFDTYYNANDSGSDLTLRASKSDIAGTMTKFADGNQIGSITFRAPNSAETVLNPSAQIRINQDGASSSFAPGKMTFETYGASALNSNVLVLDAAGNIGVGATPITQFDVSGDSVRIRTSQSPASNGAGVQGEIAWDANYFYGCVNTNTWGRVAWDLGY